MVRMLRIEGLMSVDVIWAEIPDLKKRVSVTRAAEEIKNMDNSLYVTQTFSTMSAVSSGLEFVCFDDVSCVSNQRVCSGTYLRERKNEVACCLASKNF